MKKKLFFPSHAFHWYKLYKQTSVNRHEAQPSHYACLLLSVCFFLSSSPTCSQATLGTWISCSFIKIIPSSLSKLTSDVFLPLRLHAVCPPALSATISSLDLFVLIIYICIKLSSSWALLSMLLWRDISMSRNAELGEYKPIIKYFQILFWNFYCSFVIGQADWNHHLKSASVISRSKKNPSPWSSAIRKWKKIAFHRYVMICNDLDTGMNS